MSVMSAQAAQAATQVVKQVLPKITPQVEQSVKYLKDILQSSKFGKIFDPTTLVGEAVSGSTTLPNNNDGGESAVLHLARQGMGPHIEILIKQALRGSAFKEHRKALSEIAEIISDPSKKISPEDKTTLMQLLTEITAGEKITEEAAKLQNSADTLMDGALDKVVDIIRRELNNSGSIPGMLTRIPGILPKEITDQNEMKQYIEKKLLNDDFRTCVQGYLKGETVNTSILESPQKMTLKGFKGAMWVLQHTPKIALEYLPAIGTVAGFFAKHIPFYGVVNMMLMFLGTYQNELQEMKDLMEQFHKGKDIISKSLDPITQLAANTVRDAAMEAAEKAGVLPPQTNKKAA